MNPQSITTIFMVVMAAIVVVYDVFAATYWGNDATITMVIRGLSERYPFIVGGLAFAMGAHFGHLFLTGK